MSDGVTGLTEASYENPFRTSVSVRQNGRSVPDLTHAANELALSELQRQTTTGCAEITQ
jgi:hypothetical protein